METFKINYKSDFVLRLASDAGWGTAFTLEFWTNGAPTKRYYATHDGSGNYTNCKPDSDTELRVMFDDHGLGIGNLMLRITYSLADKEFRTGKDDEVVNVAAITVLNDEGEEVNVMLNLEGETAAEVQYALPLLGNELERRRAEQERIEAEEERKSNEATRMHEEAERVDNEYLRVSNENKRKAAEQSRAENENARVAAENERLTNENLRQQQEDERRATFERTQEERAEAYLAKEAARQADFEAKEESRQATFEANEARREADTNDTIAAAEAASGNANSAADRTNKAIADASAATSFANQSAAKANTAAAKANTAAANADTATDNANVATAESKAATEEAKKATADLQAFGFYGIEFDTEVSTPQCTRIGDMSLHRTLPIQSRIRGCLLDDDGNVVEYLDPKDWRNNVRDGSRGQVMVEIPMHYRQFLTNGTKRQIRLSEFPLSGYHQVPQMYVSAYEASLERSTGKLCSVVNDSPDYRGGDNNATWDGTYRSLLGRPVTSISRTALRTAARKRKTGSTAWNCYLYQAHKAIFWLFTVEYATLNSQAAYNSELTSEGYRQGGLGAGVTDWDGTSWKNFNGYFPFVPCGHTDTLGNQTGVVSYTITDESGAELKTTNVPRYRGIENPFGHIWKWTDGINIRISPTEANGGDNLSKIFICEDTSKLNDTNYTGYQHVGNEARAEGYVKEIVFGEGGEVMPSVVGGSSTQFHCDYHYTNIPTTEALRGVLFGGAAYGGAYAGLASAYSYYAPSAANANFGSLLCYVVTA